MNSIEKEKMLKKAYKEIHETTEKFRDKIIHILWKKKEKEKNE